MKFSIRSVHEGLFCVSYRRAYDARLLTKNDARLNKPNDRTLFHWEIEDCESLVFLKRFLMFIRFGKMFVTFSVIITRRSYSVFQV